MSGGFDRLHPALQHHIVNSLGWPALRPLQERAIDPVLDGKHALLIAPTAGGKTEAAALPVLSRMQSEGWNGLSVLYLCPIKALLNNLEPRLAEYAGFLGRRVGLWHGDVLSGGRKRMLREPPDVLLTTPESLEVMLTSVGTDHRTLFANLRTVVVDELHAFAGDDRGWHLLAVVERLARIAGRDLQRIGLSATVGNPAELLHWLTGSDQGPREVIAVEAAPSGKDGLPTDLDLTLDYVGNLRNAAVVISRLHRGEKRLVFCDSRSRVEQLAHALRELKVNTFVSHSSLSADERKQAEEAFTTERDAVIVATSTLELGIDVGDLDRVIQIDAPGTVASFLQRIGRTGRRAGTQRNCLFLATNESAFLQASGLLALWGTGYVEPVEPPPIPYHVLAQQIMALALQERGIGRHTWREWIGALPIFADMARDADAIVAHMVDTGILAADGDLLGFGPDGEKRFGRRHFSELMTVFTSDPLFIIRHGRDDLGQVHPLTFSGPKDNQPVLLLAGRSWVLKYIDWKRRVAFVEPTDLRGRSQWLGAPRALNFELCQSIRRVLAGHPPPAKLTTRAQEQMEVAREEFAWVRDDATSLVRDHRGRQFWWTFAGLQANETLRGRMASLAAETARGENLAIELVGNATAVAVSNALAEPVVNADSTGSAVDEDLLAGLKFSACLPVSLAATVLAARQGDEVGVTSVIRDPVSSVLCS